MLVCYTAMAPTLNYTLSLHDALPILSARSWTRKVEISPEKSSSGQGERAMVFSDWSLIEDGTSSVCVVPTGSPSDRKSTRLNSSHVAISYAVFCLKKKNNWTA